MPTPKIQVHEITPDIARELLEKNMNNRRVDKELVTDLARAMTDGRFVFNGDTIRINERGELIDGQHRLLAVVRSGETITMAVALNLPDDVKSTIDQGKIRSVLDILAMRGAVIPDRNALSAAASLLVGFDQDLRLGRDRSLMADYIEEHTEELAPWVRFGALVAKDAPKISTRGWGTGQRRSMTQATVAALCTHMQRQGADPSTIQSFFYGLANGFALDPEVLQSLTPERLSVLQSIHKRLLSGIALARTNGANARQILLGEMAIYIVAYGRYVDNVAVRQLKAFKDQVNYWQELPKVNTGAVLNPNTEVPFDAQEIDALETVTQ